MECGEVQRALHAYVDHELSPDETDCVRSHVDACIECDRRLAELESLGRLLRALPYYSAPGGLRASVAALPGKPRKLTTWLRLAAAVIVGALLGGAAVWTGGLMRGPSQSDKAGSQAQEVVSSHVRALMAN